MTSYFPTTHFLDTCQMQSVTKKTVWKNSISLSKDWTCKDANFLFLMIHAKPCYHSSLVKDFELNIFSRIFPIVCSRKHSFLIVVYFFRVPTCTKIIHSIQWLASVRTWSYLYWTLQAGLLSLCLQVSGVLFCHELWTSRSLLALFCSLLRISLPLVNDFNSSSCLFLRLKPWHLF